MDGIAYSYMLIYYSAIYRSTKSTIYHTVHVSPNTYIIVGLGALQYLARVYNYIVHVHYITCTCMYNVLYFVLVQ